MFEKGWVHRWVSPGFVVVVIVDEAQLTFQPSMLEGNKMAERGRSGRSGRKSQVFTSQKLKNNRG